MALIAAGCHEGCWEDFKLVGKIFPSNMVHFVEALAHYAAAVKRTGLAAPTR